MGGLSAGGTVALGIIVGLLSTCVQSFGLTLQRKSHMIEDSKSEYEPRRAPYRRRRWQVGMLLFLVANVVGSSIQITTLPLPLLSTLQASGLVFNSIMAGLILKEAWTWRTLGGTALVAGGAVVISLFSALPEPSHNLDQLMELFWRRSFLIWFVLSLVWVLCFLVADFSMRKFIPLHRRQSPKIHLIRGMVYGMLSGILSAHGLLLAKSAVELIVRSLADKVNQFSSYKSWLIVLAFLVLAITQLYYLHLGLRLVSTSILYPFVFCIYNIVAILDGLICFRQMDDLPPLHAGLIALGTVILLAGVLALSWRLQDEDGTTEADHGPHAAKAEIPQTVLAPGMGFVGEPDSDNDSTPTEDGETDGQTPDADQSRPLLTSPSLRRSREAHSGRRSSGSIYSGRRRRRATTLREVLDIWEELGDHEAQERYGTFDQALAAADGRSESASAAVNDDETRRELMAARDNGPRDSAEEETLDDERSPASLRRAKTAPARTVSLGSGRRRSVIGSHHRPQGSALFSDMLKLDWWRARRKPAGEDDDDDDGEGASEPRQG